MVDLIDIVRWTKDLGYTDILHLSFDVASEDYIIEYLDLCGYIEGEFGAEYKVYPVRDFDSSFGNIPWMHYVMRSEDECVRLIEDHYRDDLDEFKRTMEQLMLRSR